MKRITVLGATGSIGQSTLDVISRNPERFDVFALSAATNVDDMEALCRAHTPQYAVMQSTPHAEQLKNRLKDTQVTVLAGEKALEDIAASADVDMVMAAIVGAAGLLPTLAAVKAGKTVLLANKEALVMSGQLFIDAVKASGATLLPIDSEHNAIFQSMPHAVQQQAHSASLSDNGISKILLTGSGGPFRERALSSFEEITPAEAIAHPNWSMGQKISVDSATMMNKGLEFIEAKWLFNATPNDIEVVIHPQSIIHSMVQYTDGSVLAQMGQPDMRTPIAHAMAFPERIGSGVAPLDFASMRDFSFLSPDAKRYPNLFLAIEACRIGQGATTAINAANEVAVAAFIAEQIGFMDIYRVNQHVFDALHTENPTSLDCILALDEKARVLANHFIQTGLSTQSVFLQGKLNA